MLADIKNVFEEFEKKEVVEVLRKRMDVFS